MPIYLAIEQQQTPTTMSTTNTFKITTQAYTNFDLALAAKGYRLSLIEDERYGRDLDASQWVRADRMIVVGRIDGEITSIKADVDDGFIGDFTGKHSRADEMIAEVEDIYRQTVMAE